MFNVARKIRSEKLREHQYIKEYVRCFVSKRVEWHNGKNIEQMWKEVKQALVDSAREVCGSVRGGRTQTMYGGMMW